MGQLIPAGTGTKKYSTVLVEPPEEELEENQPMLPDAEMLMPDFKMPPGMEFDDTAITTLGASAPDFGATPEFENDDKELTENKDVE
jgi:hypothetical protein